MSTKEDYNPDNYSFNPDEGFLTYEQVEEQYKKDPEEEWWKW